MKEFEHLKELLLKKEQIVTTELDKEKVQNIKEIFQDDSVFFKLDTSTIVGILDFLGIPEDEIRDYYFKLISPENYHNTSKPYIL